MYQLSGPVCKSTWNSRSIHQNAANCMKILFRYIAQPEWGGGGGGGGGYGKPTARARSRNDVRLLTIVVRGRL